jgi:hypothetical protein
LFGRNGYESIAFTVGADFEKVDGATKEDVTTESKLI